MHLFATFALLPLLTGLLVVLGAPAALAGAGDLYSCKIKEEAGTAKLLPPEVTVAHLDGDERYIVTDAVSYTFLKKPVEATVLEDSAKRLELSWEVPIEGESDGRPGAVHARLAFRLVIFRPALKARLNAKPLGYRNTSVSGGACTMRRAKL